MGFGDLINNISENVGGAIDSLSAGLNPLNSAKKYPVFTPPITNDPDYKDGSWRLSKGYEFSVVKVWSDGTIIGKADDYQDFRLQINPQELSQDEVFAINVTPTLRGVLVEHQGSTLKDITISGTTGVSPKRKDGGAKRSNGAPVMASGHSGYEEFHELRSYFRSYVETKRLDTEGEIRMVFKNLRDAEYIFVEPQKFTMKRSARRATLYDYTIQLKGIGVAVVSAGVSPSSIVDLIDSALDYLAYAEQIVAGSIGLLRSIERDISNTLLAPLRTINGILSKVKGGKEYFFGDYGVTRRFVKQFKDEVERIEANFNDLIGRDMANFNKAVGRVTTLKGVTGRASTYNEVKTLNALQSLKKGLVLILSEKKFFEKDTKKVTKQSVSEYTKRKATVTGTNDANGNPIIEINNIKNPNINIPVPNSVRTVTIDGNDSIQTLAARELGSPDKFKDIVILNNLKPPYISATGGDNVLKPGDAIKIPQSKALKSSDGTRQNVDYNITKFLQQSEKNLGVDIMITPDNDLAVSNTGDLGLVAGVPNMGQSLGIRMALESGSLKRHPQIGVGLQIGVKVQNLEEIKEKIIKSLSIDGRIETIPFLELFQDGGTTTINMLVKMKHLNQPVPIPITL